MWFQELERQKHTCSVLQHKQEELKEGIRQRDELIEVWLHTRLKAQTVSACDYIELLFCQHFKGAGASVQLHERLCSAGI